MARSRRQRVAPARRLVVDSGAVIALARGDARARAVLAAAWEARAEVVVPAVVVAETVRGRGPDAAVNRVLKAVGEAMAVDEAVGRTAGALLGQVRSSATIDALVVASAIGTGGGVVLTGDPEDLRPLAAGHPEVAIRAL